MYAQAEAVSPASVHSRRLPPAIFRLPACTETGRVPVLYNVDLHDAALVAEEASDKHIPSYL